jgi:hypothetical protein
VDRFVPSLVSIDQLQRATKLAFMAGILAAIFVGEFRRAWRETHKKDEAE